MSGTNSGQPVEGDQVALEQDIVRAVNVDMSNPRDPADRGGVWQRILVDFEAQWQGDEPVTSVLSFGVVEGAEGALKKVSFRLSEESHALFARLAQAMAARDGDFWVVSHLVIEAGGQFSFVFSYDGAYRLAGNLHDTRLADYVERYRAERSTTR